MLPTEQTRFFEIISRTLNAYGKFPDTRELEAWWHECRNLSLEGLDSALRSHREDQDRGERAPRPVDITRRMKVGNRDANKCAATDPTGRCEYPGIFSEGTGGDGPWYCPWHRIEHAGPEASAWIERSREIPYEVAKAKREERMTAEAQRTPTVIATAWDMAHNARAPRGNFSSFIPPAMQREEDAA